MDLGRRRQSHVFEDKDIVWFIDCFPQIGDACLSLGQHLESVAKF